MTVRGPLEDERPLAAPPDRGNDRDDDPYDETHTVVAVMGGAERKGMWCPPGRLRVFAMMGSVTIDLREADLLDETEIYALGFMGGVHIIVPPTVEVDASGVGFIGDFSSSSHRGSDPDARLIRVRGMALIGGVSVTVKKLSLARRLLGR